MSTKTAAPLHIEVRYGNVKLSDKAKAYLETKLDHLRKYSERIGDESSLCRVEFEQRTLKSQGYCVKCEVTLSIPQAVIRAEVAGTAVEEVIDRAILKLRRQIERYKCRWNGWDKKSRQDIRGHKEVPVSFQKSETTAEDAFGALPQISKRKQYSHIQPMTEIEAAERMELIGHDFFLFLNKETSRFSVVYKKEDGTYGLIEPKVATEN
ncbi:ribosome-associated translation inhibitor RaiA [Candidatus Peregrinibacteria bacterium]|nr:ribosome-associated translation inhibitor RaiA [Candidatus Peregrinibacteria bacterium]